ncbi:MAG: CoA transferase [Betaproteobacteria bacterium]|nr:CoA transferase [Betaproteobacteria bacterium]
MEDQRPCAGIKGLAVTRILGSPFAAYQLALHGAEVIQIEEPKVGDNARRAGGRNAQKFVDAGMGHGFLAHGANKKSLTFNLRNPEGQDVFRKLARNADVIIENLRVGAMERYGLGYEAMRELNPRIVYSSLTGYGQTGPKKHAAAVDNVIQAGSGMMSITGTPESGPLKVGTSIVDYAAGYALALGIVMALFQRERTGRGQYVDVSLIETALAIMSRTISDVMNSGLAPKLIGNRGENDSHVLNCFKCSDTYLQIAAVQEHQRQRLWQAIGRPDIPADPRFANIGAMRLNADALYAEIGRTLKTRSASEWASILGHAGVPASRVNTLAEAVEDPQIKSRKLYHTFDRIPGVDAKVAVPLAPYKLSEGAARIDSPPPRLGQHTDEILSSLGYSDADIGRMRSSGVV